MTFLEMVRKYGEENFEYAKEEIMEALEERDSTMETLDKKAEEIGEELMEEILKDPNSGIKDLAKSMTEDDGVVVETGEDFLSIIEHIYDENEHVQEKVEGMTEEEAVYELSFDEKIIEEFFRDAMVKFYEINKYDPETRKIALVY